MDTKEIATELKNLGDRVVVILRNNRRVMFEAVLPDPFCAATIQENIFWGIKATMVGTGNTFLLWFRRDMTEYGAPLSRKIVTIALQTWKENR